jgi:H+/Na+-translocating ferredoxin:NAD+ oxidoreductase subunit C
MKTRSFSGGVHPPEKKLTAKVPVVKLPAPEEIVVPLSMHIGAPAKPLVSRGDRVLRGQAIAEPGGFVSAYIHSPVSGKVKKIEPRPHPMGRALPSIVIINDGLDECVDFQPVDDWKNAEPDVLIEAIQKAGIVGMGGALFPTHVKLKPPPQFSIDTVIINGVECEPYLTADHRLMLEQPDKVLEGLRIILRILNLKKGYIGIEANKPDAIELLRMKTANADDIEIVDLHVKYPQGGEKTLIYACTGREVPSGGLPMNCGCVVQNVGTMAAICDAITEGKPLMERNVTVTGECIKNPVNLLARIGTPISKLIEAAGGFTETPAKIIGGGPMMGMTQSSLVVPVTKGTSGLVCLPPSLVSTSDPSPCLRCGSCVRHCPFHLLPTDIVRLVKAGRADEAADLGLMDCCECGSCSYICPSHIELLQWMRLGKAEVMANRKKTA